jgi:hypothetical protein
MNENQIGQTEQKVPVNLNSSGEAVNAQPPAAQQPEKLLPQHEVNSLIGAAKQKGLEKGYQQAQAEFQAAQQHAMQQQYSQPPQQQPGQQPQNMMPQQGQNPAMSPQQQPAGGQPINDADRLRQIAAEEFAKQQQQMHQNAIAYAQQQHDLRTGNELAAKIAEAKTRYPDFDKVVSLDDFAKMPDILRLANTVDNAGDVFYEMAKNPSKVSSLRGLPQDSQLAVNEVKRLSDSIKQNQLAASQPQTSEPLNQVKPSNVGVDSGAPKTVSDMRKALRKR